MTLMTASMPDGKATSPALADRAGPVYLGLVREQIDKEMARKSSLEQRGALVATTAAGLVTLIFTLTHLGAENSFSELPIAERATTSAAILLFVLAAGLGVGCSWPQPYLKIKADDLTNLGRPLYWNAAKDIAERRVFEVLLSTWASAQQRNSKKARILITAMSALVTAIALVATAILLNL
jgi:hypothetical protein